MMMIEKFLSKLVTLHHHNIFPYTTASVRKKAIFIHIPKAAGTAVRKALGEGPTGRQHLPWWIYQQASPEKFMNFYKFSFVRNPIDRAFSGYRYLKKGGNQMEDLIVCERLKNMKHFDDFVERELLYGKMLYHPIFRPQSWYLCDWNGDIKVDYVGKFESINRDFKTIAQTLNLKNFDGLSVENRSSGEIETISEATKKTIMQIYADDYKAFNY